MMELISEKLLELQSKRITDRNGHRKVPVNCIDCCASFLKWRHSLKEWKGRCSRCAAKEVTSRLEVKQALRLNGKAVTSKYGGIRNAKKFSSIPKEQHPRWKGGKPVCMCGKKLAAYTSKTCIDCRNIRKENHWNWKGGKTKLSHTIRTSRQYKLWQKEVFERDRYYCVFCGYRSRYRGDIHADHIKPFYLYEENRFDVDNGRTLCANCHRKHGFNYKRYIANGSN